MIYVMDNFLWIEITAKMLFHHQAMLSDIAVAIMVGMVFA